VDLAQFMQLWQNFKAFVNEDGDATEEEIMTFFREYDLNGDGYVTKDEIMQASVT
jgi:Ca2+-binding EF-hand superfamily protein